MTKKQLADLLILGKTGGQTAPNSKYDRRDFYIYAEIAFDDAVGKARKTMGSEFLSADFVKRYKDVQLYYDKSIGESFFVIPCQIVNNGLVGVSPPRGNDYIIQYGGAASVYDDLESGVIIDNMVCVQYGNRVYFQRSGKIDICVTVRVIPSGSSYGEGDQLPIPTDFEDYMVSRAMELSQGQAATTYKKTNDNNFQSF